ncbi:MAG: cytochrome C biogenesis protein [Ignavibacteriae bacterium]|nr:cytochrome C biogenesis protein [Ignavibacteriota bacterium]
MLDDLFTTLSMAMMDSYGVALAASFAWGIASILLSPCHLTSIPLIIGYISRQAGMNTRRSFGISLVFATGILITIAGLGLLTASLGRMMGDVGIWGNIIVAALFFVVGLYLLEIISFSWGALPMRPLEGRPWIGAFVLGLVFGVGLGPCTFAYLAPVLGVVFSIGSEDVAAAAGLIGAFAVGHCAVIVAAGTLAQLVQRYLQWTEQTRGAVWMRRVAGVCVILGGVYFVYTAF